MLILGIAGGSGSGKTTVVKKMTERLPKSSVAIISQDSYYYDSSHMSPEDRAKINVDHPSSIEFDLLIKHLDMLRKNETIQMPIYSYITRLRAQETLPVNPQKVIIVEGILILTNEELRNRLDIKVFVDADADDRLTRIIWRDIEERGRSVKDVLNHYESYVKPMHLQFIEPTKHYADIIIPQGGENEIGIDILSSRVRMNLEK